MIERTSRTGLRTLAWFVVPALALAAAVGVADAGVLGGAALFLAAVAAVVLGWASRGVDGTDVLTVYLVALFVIPANMVVGPLGAVGAPALLLSIGLAGWWATSRVDRRIGGHRGRQPLRPVLLGHLGVVLACYGMAATQLLSDVQRSSANRAVLTAFGLVGVALVAADGTDSFDRLRTLVRRIVIGGGYVAFVAVLQFQNIVDLSRIAFPGLVVNNPVGLDERSGFDRVIGTTSHPIEAGAVMGMIFPLALHLLVFGSDRRERRIGAVVTALIAVAVPMTVSRTAPVVLAVGAALLVVTWPPRLRRRGLVVGAMGLVAIRLLFPGLLGTVRSLFEYAGVDPSVTGRTQDYGVIFQLFDDNPVFGIGPGTFLPESYFFLDNQFLGTAVETGTLGLMVLILLFVTAVVLGVCGRRRSADPETRDLGQALVAGLLAGVVSFATFDALGFAMFAGLWFALLGVIAAYWRLAPTSVPPAPHHIESAEVPA